MAPDMLSAELVNVPVSEIRSAMEVHPDYTKIKAPCMAIDADADLHEVAGKLDEETTRKLAAWWKEKQVPITRASIDAFRKDMKNGQIVEIKGATHYVFVGPFKDRVVGLIRDFLGK